MKKKVFSQWCIRFMLAFIALFVYQGVAIAGVTGKIAGTIKDADTGEPIPGVNVVIVGTTMGAATSLDGHYFIVHVPPGTYSVEASMMGYEKVTKTGVIVSVDRTITVDFELKVTIIEGAKVTVVAEREIVPMDVSATQIVADGEKITQVPLVTDIFEYANLQAGIQGGLIRGGGLDQTAFLLDGLTVVDNRGNEPLVMVNLSSVAEMNIITGGFNAEYGNIRSGLINVVTKEGSPTRYHGSIEFRYSPPHLKHRGHSLIDPMNFYLRPYLDPEVMWEGTENGGWDEETRKQYPSFIGWDAVSSKTLADDDPSNDLTPEQARDLFLWQHAAEGSAALGQKEMKYGHKPDWIGEASLGGPVPFIGKYLGDLSFFGSYRRNQEMFGLPTAREYFTEENAHLKLTSRLSPNMKLTVEGLYGEIETVSQMHGGSPNSYLRDPREIFDTEIVAGAAFEDRQGGQIFFPSSLTPFNVYRSMAGIAFDHVLSPSTFYNVRITHVRVKNSALGPDKWRDTTTVRYFGNVPVDEQPYGFAYENGIQRMEDGMIYGAIGAWVRDWSEVNTLSVKFDLTSQIDRYNQIKAGFMFNYDDFDSRFGNLEWLWEDVRIESRVFPYRLGAYVQDKLEFEGMIANFGLRLDYNNPNTDWYTVDRYSKYFKRGYADVFTEQAPKEPAKGHLKLSPRLGIAHPISERAKLYFNYGHFYSMPISDDMFRILFFNEGALKQVEGIGNPSADVPRTVAYELGVEYNVADLFLISLAGYYKNVTNQTGEVRYTNIDESVDYFTIENNHYADIRGFELRIDRRFGQWITGWLNYNYMVTTNGFVGREHYFEDVRLQRLYGLQNPYQEIPLARPFLRANVLVTSPNDFGPAIIGIKPLADVRLSLLYTWRAGRYETWDPLRTYELRDNVQWKDRYNVDARLSKSIRLGNQNLTLFVDVQNLFDFKYMEPQGFRSRADYRNYMESLHLPMYEGEEYKARGLMPGNDRPGDIKSKDKPYIDMPDRKFLTFLNPRSIFWGIKVEF